MEPRTYLGPARHLIRDAPVTITSYGVFGEILTKRAWRLVVFDEAHRLRNRKTRTLFKIAERNQSQHQFLLTGTPQVSSLEDLWALFHLTDKTEREFRYFWPFVSRYMFKEHNGFGWQISGAQNTEELRRRTARFFLRRLERTVAPERPPVTRQPIRLEMEGAQAKAYEQMATDMLIKYGDNWIAAPTEIAKGTRLRQLCVTPLLLGIPDEGAGFRALREMLDDLGAPAVIFTPFTKAIPLLAQYLHGGVKTYQLSGQDRNPGAVARAFNNDTTVRRVLIAQVTMAEGWDATAASHAYFLGLDWSPTAHQQAERRLQRHGQHHPVTAHYLLHKGTIELAQMDVLDTKTTLRKLMLDPQTLLHPRAVAG
jgi:SNF2 family DNA or RNA helicase